MDSRLLFIGLIWPGGA